LLVHNYFNLQTVADVEKVEETELKQLFGAKKNIQGFWLSKNFKHFVIAHSSSPAGQVYNSRAIENIRTMIKGANAALNPDVLGKIVKEIELLLGKVLIKQLPEKPVNVQNASQKREDYVGRAINFVTAMWRSGSTEQLKVSNKHQVQVELEVKNVTVQTMEPLWFICPKQILSDNIILSNDLAFNQDGSIYVDFSSQFVPNLNIVRLNDDGDVGIRIECPACAHVTADRQGMTAILVQGEKMDEPSQKQYLNTRRIGKFEIQISLDGLEYGLILNIGAMKTEFSDGVITITIPSDKKGKKKIDNDEL